MQEDVGRSKPPPFVREDAKACAADLNRVKAISGVLLHATRLRQQLSRERVQTQPVRGTLSEIEELRRLLSPERDRIRARLRAALRRARAADKVRRERQAAEARRREERKRWETARTAELRGLLTPREVRQIEHQFGMSLANLDRVKVYWLPARRRITVRSTATGLQPRGKHAKLPTGAKLIGTYAHPFEPRAFVLDLEDFLATPEPSPAPPSSASHDDIGQRRVEAPRSTRPVLATRRGLIFG